MTYDFDFAVAGGGPAGSSAAIALAQRGHSVVLFEREAFPRFHIGESLLSTANEAFAALGLAEKMAAANFPVKWGARLFTHDGLSGRGRVDEANRDGELRDRAGRSGGRGGVAAGGDRAEQDQGNADREEPAPNR